MYDPELVIAKMKNVRIVDATRDVGCCVVYLGKAMRYVPGAYTPRVVARKFLRAIGAH